MKSKDEEQSRDEEQHKIDPNLDIPSEANTTKHINFLDIENGPASSKGRGNDDSTEERRKQWEQGLKEGKEDREKQ
jgi:hypothetical protein